MPTDESRASRLLIRERCKMFGHEWEYDEEESKGPWTGYIEKCERCGEIQQVPQ